VIRLTLSLQRQPLRGISLFRSINVMRKETAREAEGERGDAEGVNNPKNRY